MRSMTALRYKRVSTIKVSKVGDLKNYLANSLLKFKAVLFAIPAS